MSEPRPLPAGALFRFGSALYLAIAVAALVWIGVRDGRITVGVFVSPESWPRDIALGLAVGGGMLAAWLGLRSVSATARDLERRLAELLGGLSGSDALGLALLSGLAEELLFRGAMQPTWGFWPATILFALAHTGRGRSLWLWTVSAFVAGACLGLVFEHTGNLAAPVVAHTLVNAVQLSRLTAPPAPPPDAA